jgi:hypothetical protein
MEYSVSISNRHQTSAGTVVGADIRAALVCTSQCATSSEGMVMALQLYLLALKCVLLTLKSFYIKAGCSCCHIQTLIRMLYQVPNKLHVANISM